jgi:hypothetical protein
MVIHRLNPATTHFLNVDLDIYSKADLRSLVTALGKRVMVLYLGRIRRTHSAHLELAKITKTADATIRGFCSLIEALPKLERDLWNAAKVRDFNIGVQAGTQPHSTEFALAAATLKAAHELGARIVFTVYAPEHPRKPVAKGHTHSKKAADAHPKPAV